MSMSTDKCGKGDGSIRCTRGAGHEGPHSMEILLPADVGQMIDAHITQLDEATEQMREAKAKMIKQVVIGRWLMGGMIGALVFNVAMGIVAIAGNAQ